MSQNLTLLTLLCTVRDHRRSQGTRHPLGSTLLMIILATMAGCVGYREIGTYLIINKKELCALLNLKKERVPTYVTIRSILQSIDYEELRTVFVTWAQNGVALQAGWQFAIDGKSLRSTVTNSQTEEQNFVSMVTMFCAELGCIWEVKRLETGKSGEMTAVQTLLEAITVKGFLFTLDALHSKKKQQR